MYGLRANLFERLYTSVWLLYNTESPLSARFSASQVNFARVRVRIMHAIDRLHLVIPPCLCVCVLRARVCAAIVYQ